MCLNCPEQRPVVLIQVPESHVVMISFRLFDLEADPTCRYDYLDVYNGHSRLVQKLGRFCGTFRPGALISTSNTMMLEMVSDEATGGRGFLAYFSAGKPHMEGVDMEGSLPSALVFCLELKRFQRPSEEFKVPLMVPHQVPVGRGRKK